MVSESSLLLHLANCLIIYNAQDFRMRVRIYKDVNDFHMPLFRKIFLSPKHA